MHHLDASVLFLSFSLCVCGGSCVKLLLLFMQQRLNIVGHYANLTAIKQATSANNKYEFITLEVFILEMSCAFELNMDEALFVQLNKI